MRKEQIVVNTLVFDEWMKEGMHQIELLEKLSELGIQKVEIRREYLRDKAELSELKEKAAALEMDLFYSVPDILFQGRLLDKETLLEYAEEYTLLGAKQLKIVGGYAEDLAEEDTETLKNILEEGGIHHLTLENDQSEYSSAETLLEFIRSLQHAGIEAGITFDTGNFVIIGEDPLESAKILKDHTTFIHMKNVDAATHQMTLVDEGSVPMLEVTAIFPEEVNRAIEYPCGKDAFRVLENELEKLLN